jgi:hypothetical protein
MAPASVTKLFSGAAALVALGADHTQETAIYQRGIVVKGTLRGDLIFVASGDLMLGGRTKNGKTVFKDKDHTYANGTCLARRTLSRLGYPIIHRCFIPPPLPCSPPPQDAGGRREGHQGRDAARRYLLTFSAA